jgi:hypothetical protein
VAISKLIAPSMPYMAEVLYQNLVLSVDAGAGNPYILPKGLISRSLDRCNVES